MSQTLEQFHLFRIRVFKDKKSFEILLNIHGDKMKKFLASKLPSRQEAEDAYGQTCLKLWEYATNHVITHFSGLMGSIARTEIAGFYRMRSRRPVEVSLETDDGIIPLASKQSGKKITEYVDGELMKQSLSLLEEEDCQVVTMRYFGGCSIREIAEDIKKTEEATKMQLHRALKKLREIIETKNRRV